MVTVAEYHAMQARDMRERALQEKVRQIAAPFVAAGRLLAYHTWMSINSAKGLPDCILTRPTGGLLVAELKRECACRPGRAPCRYHPTPEQQAWLDSFAASGAATFVWQPSDELSGGIAREIARFVGICA